MNLLREQRKMTLHTKRNDSLWDLAYWQTGEYQVIQERLEDEERNRRAYCPNKCDLFNALSLDCSKVRAVIVGQDPYPNPAHATGYAFSVRGSTGLNELPPTLKNIFKEYQDDLHYPAPKNGDLTKWVEEGVLLWNAYPSCQAWKPGSHHWDEWRGLTDEILKKVDSKGPVVFVFLGSVARDFSNSVLHSHCIYTSHPSPLGARRGFLGSRIFSTVNAKLCEISQPPINWRLPDA